MSMKKVLIVEDETALLYALKAELSRSFEVLEAVDGEKALKTIEENQPDLIILDVLLPGINGFEVLKRIKKSEKTKNIPVIILSNLGEKENIAKGKNLGADDYLIKTNYTLEEIVQKLKKLIINKK